MLFETFIERVKAQQKTMGYFDFINESEENRMLYLRDISLALTLEVSEMIQEMPWKPWKPIAIQPLDTEAAALELCDIFVFCTVLWITINPSMSIEDALEATLSKIDKRIGGTYGRQTTI